MAVPSLDELSGLVRGETPAARLEAAIALGRELSETGDALIGRFVAEARSAGLSWAEIGASFGTSKQAVQQRWGAVGGGWRGRSTPGARRALDHAVELARELGHGSVGTEHALLALATGDDGAAEVLAGLGATRERILGTRCMQPRPLEATERLGVMPRLKQALEHSRRIADDLGRGEAGGEHLLAGIVAVEDSLAVEILRRLGVRPEAVRAALAERLDVEPGRLGAARRRRRRLTRRP
jgi:Clp amino terminal domain, pathogenicity island component